MRSLQTSAEHLAGITDTYRKRFRYGNDKPRGPNCGNPDRGAPSRTGTFGPRATDDIDRARGPDPWRRLVRILPHLTSGERAPKHVVAAIRILSGLPHKQLESVDRCAPLRGHLICERLRGR